MHRRPALRSLLLAPLTVVAALTLGACGGDGGESLFGTADDEVEVVTVERAARTGIAVGDIVEVPDDHELVTPRGGDVEEFAALGDGRYAALEAGSFEVVAYEEMDCGGPVDAFPHYVIEVGAADEATDDDDDNGLFGWRAVPAGAPAPQC